MVELAGDNKSPVSTVFILVPIAVLITILCFAIFCATTGKRWLRQYRQRFALHRSKTSTEKQDTATRDQEHSGDHAGSQRGSREDLGQSNEWSEIERKV